MLAFPGQPTIGKPLAISIPNSVFRLVHHTHAAATRLVNDAVVRDRLPNHWRESYVGEAGKPIKAMGLLVLPRSLHKGDTASPL